MNWERVCQSLADILGVEGRLRYFSKHEWLPGMTSMHIDGLIYFYASSDDEKVTTISLDAVMTVAEQRLIEMMLEQFKESAMSAQPVHSLPETEEQQVELIRTWLLEELEYLEDIKEQQKNHHKTHDGLNRDRLIKQVSLPPIFHKRNVPILLEGGYNCDDVHAYEEFKKLLGAFFDHSIYLIPLQAQQWFILCEEHFLTELEAEAEQTDDHEDEQQEQHVTKRALVMLAEGLHEMMQESIGECHVTVTFPIVPALEIKETLFELRIVMELGRTYQRGSFIHMPWNQALEKMIHSLSDSSKMTYVSTILKDWPNWLDAESQNTLEQFFALDCNVSEAAKKLYIHRNTLLYRLDRIRQVTEMDVRSFNQAVHVKLALLLLNDEKTRQV